MLFNVDRHLRHRGANGDEPEFNVIPSPDSHYVVFVAVNVESLQEPGVARLIVQGGGHVLHTTKRGAQCPSDPEVSLVLVRIQTAYPDKEWAGWNYAQVPAGRNLGSG